MFTATTDSQKKVDFALFREHFCPQKSKNGFDLFVNFPFIVQNRFQKSTPKPPFDHYLNISKFAFFG